MESVKSMKLYDTNTFRTISIVKIVPKRGDNNKNISCVATSAVSREEKSSLTILKLLFKPVVRVIQDTPKEDESDEQLRFNCFTEARPKASKFEWYLNDIKMSGEDTDKLVLDTNIMKTPEGEVKCMATNIIGQAANAVKLQLNCK